MTSAKVAVLLLVVTLLPASLCEIPQSEAQAEDSDGFVADLVRFQVLHEAGDLLGAYHFALERARNGVPQWAGVLAFMIRRGETPIVSDSEAIKWYRQAADEGDQDALHTLCGLYYSGGNDVNRDYTEAGRWCTLSATRTISEPPDLMLDEPRMRRFIRSMRQMNQQSRLQKGFAQWTLGIMCENGEGRLKDYEAAARWYWMAASENFAPAQGALGKLYFLGHGVPEDLVEAHKWLNLAGATDQSYQEFRDAIEQRLTKGQVVAAQALAREWLLEYRSRAGKEE